MKKKQNMFAPFSCSEWLNVPIILSLMIAMNLCPQQLSHMFVVFQRFNASFIQRLDTNRQIKMFAVSLATALALAVNEAIKLMLEHKAGRKSKNWNTQSQTRLSILYQM